MTATTPDRLALTRRALGSHCVAARVLENGEPCFALADGTLWFGVGDAARAVTVHDGLLAAVLAPDGHAMLSAGEDGRVCQTLAGGGSDAAREGATTLLGQVPRRWVTALAASRAGAVAWASGATAWVRDAGGGVREIRHSRAIEAMALSPTGTQLGLAGYDGLALHTLDTPADGVATEPLLLPWKGVHTGIVYSPDGRFVVSRLKDATLHAWRLFDGRGMRMGVYPANVGDWAFSAGGRWLVTSGAGAAVAWPFEGADGPMRQTALELGDTRESPVTAVACHPVQDIVAMGHADGCLRLAHLATGQQRTLREPGLTPDGITSLAWQRDGLLLAFGSAGGECGAVFFPPDADDGSDTESNA